MNVYINTQLEDYCEEIEKRLCGIAFYYFMIL